MGVLPLPSPSLPPRYPGVRQGAPPSPHSTPTSSNILDMRLNNYLNKASESNF